VTNTAVDRANAITREINSFYWTCKWFQSQEID